MHHQGSAVSLRSIATITMQFVTVGVVIVVGWLVGGATMATSLGSGAAIAVFAGNMARWSGRRKPEPSRDVTGRPHQNSGPGHE